MVADIAITGTVNPHLSVITVTIMANECAALPPLTMDIYRAMYTEMPSVREIQE